MSPIESIIYLIWRGIAIGVLISAPMGPVGILCIQRTLDRGRKAGLFTGIGAAISDLFYCLLTGFGLSFIENFLNENQNTIQLAGSVVLIGFSIYLFRKNPSAGMRRPVPQNVSARKNILGGFLFTFSNPLIIFLIIGLFARFNFTLPEIKGYYYVVGYLFIIIGALLWWYAITYIIDRIRMRFNMKSMKRLNVIIGIVILCFACVGIASSIIGLATPTAKAATFPAPDCDHSANLLTNASDSILWWRLHSSATPTSRGQIDFKLANMASAPMKKYHYSDSSGKRHSSKLPPWHFRITGSDWNLIISAKIKEIEPSAVDSQSALEFTLTPDADSFYNYPEIFPLSKTVGNGLNTGNGFNHFRLCWDKSTLSLRAGNHKLKTLFDIPNPVGKIHNIEIGIDPGGEIITKQFRFSAADYPGRISPSIPYEEINMRLRSSTDPLEKEWKMLDINLNDKYLAEGGDYTVALVKAPDSSYDIIYIGGASVNSEAWQPGFLKGRLSPTGLPGIFNLEWIDAFGSLMTHHLKARLLSEDELSLQFPYHDSSITLKAR